MERLGAELQSQLTEMVREMAVDAIDRALAEGGDPKDIGAAQEALSRGDADRASQRFKAAIERYRQSLRSAEKALKP